MEHININLLKEIQQLQFASLEMALYLNTHPKDRRALDKRNQLVRELRQLMQKYNEKYTPLSLNAGTFDYPWAWIEEPWPWQIKY
ncbi:MAG: spore coat protein CotJB [Halanaerobiales bacterium]